MNLHSILHNVHVVDSSCLGSLVIALARYTFVYTYIYIYMYLIYIICLTVSEVTADKSKKTPTLQQKHFT